MGLLQIRSGDNAVSRDPLVLTEEIDEHSLGGLGLGSTLAISIEAFLSRKIFSLILISMAQNVLVKCRRFIDHTCDSLIRKATFTGGCVEERNIGSDDLGSKLLSLLAT